MAGTTQRAGARRRQEERAAEARRERLVLYATVAVLGIAAVLIAVGVYITQYLPPRAHVTTIGGTEYNAGAVARRTNHFRLFDLGRATLTDLVAQALDRLEREELLRQRAPAVVGEVSDEDVDKELRALLGFADPEADQAGYTDALRNRLRISTLRRDEHEDYMRAVVLDKRLREKFTAEAPKTAPQVHLARLRLNDQAAAERAREQAAGGADFAKLASEQSIDTVTKPNGGDLGWSLRETLAPEVRDAVANLQPGGVSAVVRAGTSFEVYKVLDANPEREVEEPQKAPLAAARVEAWAGEQRASFTVERDLSNDERKWIEERVNDHFAKLVREQTGG